MPLLLFSGSRNFRQRLVCSTLSGRAMRIENIHEDDPEHPGLRSFEVSFLRLLEKLSNGCSIQINQTGTSVFYRPGVLCGGNISHDCSNCGRSIGYFIEGIICLAPFGKEPLTLSLTGITNDNLDMSADLLRAVLLPNLARFGIGEGLDLQISQRGANPNGGGEVVFTCPNVRTLKPIQLTDDGLIRRIRGVAYCARCSPQTANRAIEGARNVLNKFARDIFIFSDFRKGKEGGLSPGFAISLVAETTTGCLLSAELSGEPGDIPEEIGKNSAELLLNEISKRGCIDTSCQWTTLLLMLLSTEDVSKVKMGKLSQFTVDCLRLYRDVFGAMFKISPDSETDTITLSCLGIGYSNIAKRIY